MSKTRILAIVLGASCAVGLVFLASAWTGESSATAKANYCDSLRNLSSTVMQYEGLNPLTATNDELSTAADDIANAYDDVVDNANDWANAYDNPLTAAYDDLYWAIDALPSDYTVAQDLDALQPEFAAFPQAFQETFDGSGCSSAS
jgi:hypothetical protein